MYNKLYKLIYQIIVYILKKLGSNTKSCIFLPVLNGNFSDWLWFSVTLFLNIQYL